MVDRYGDNRLLTDQFHCSNLGLQRMHRRPGYAFIVLSSWSMMNVDDLRLTCGENLEPSRVERIHETPLPLNDHDLGSLVVPSLQNRMLDLSGNEVIDQGIHSHSVAS